MSKILMNCSGLYIILYDYVKSKFQRIVLNLLNFPPIKLLHCQYWLWWYFNLLGCNLISILVLTSHIKCNSVIVLILLYLEVPFLQPQAVFARHKICASFVINFTLHSQLFGMYCYCMRRSWLHFWNSYCSCWKLFLPLQCLLLVCMWL